MTVHPENSTAPTRTSPSPSTTAVHAGREERVPGNQVGAPLVLTSTYVAGTERVYARGTNPTWSAFEEAVGSLENGEALVFASGMAAIAGALALTRVGAVVVTPDSAYNGTVSTLLERERRGELTYRPVDVADTGAVLAALDGLGQGDLLWLENPTNPLLQVAELETLVGAAKAQGLTVVVDNTFATPLLQRPLELGADVVVHSATKYLAGHSDVVLGVVVTAATDHGRVLREGIAHHRLLHGAIAGPMETWLALRGLRTLAVRLERACANAAELASRLSSAATQLGIERVRYPGFGAMVSIEVAGGPARADAVARACTLFVPSTSLGGVESQIERRRAIPTEPHTVPENLLRLSVGIEDVEDLWADLRRAVDVGSR